MTWCVNSDSTPAIKADPKTADRLAMGQLHFVIPAHNESGSVGKVVREALTLYPQAFVVVVDDGSSDQTAVNAQNAGARVVSLPFNCGYGAALQAGLVYAERRNASQVVTLDADGQHDPGEIAHLLVPLENDAADIVIGSRYLDHGAQYRVPFARRAGAMAFSALVSSITGRHVTDPTSGFQAMNAGALSVIARLCDFPEKSPDADLLVYSHRRGLRLAEVPVKMYADTGCDSMHGFLRSLFYVPNMLIALTGVLLSPGK